jgi:protein TonB
MKYCFLLFICFAAGAFHKLAAQSNDDSVVAVLPVKTIKKAASFPGGLLEWRKFLERTLDRDVPVKGNAPIGKYTASLSFVIDTVGKVTDLKVLDDPGYGMGAEAMRAINRSPLWLPATVDGKKVRYTTRQKVMFMRTQ